MATEKQPKAPKTPKTPVALPVRIQDQLSKAVLGKKISKEELEKLGAHIQRLTAFLDA